MCYNMHMSVLTFRTDPGVDQALDFLAKYTGTSKSQVIRNAVLAAEREARRERMKQEALALTADPADLKEAQAVRAFMGGSDAW